MQPRRLLIPFLLLVLFFGPVLVAVLVYLGPREWTGAGDAAYGELLDPLEPLPRVVLAPASGGRLDRDPWSLWSLIYARTSACLRACIEELNRLNQVRLALGDERDRVQLVLLHTGARPGIPDNAEVFFGRLDAPGASAALEFLGKHGIENGRVFVVDPLGNLVMRYGDARAQDEIFEDLKRLIDLAILR